MVGGFFRLVVEGVREMHPQSVPRVGWSCKMRCKTCSYAAVLHRSPLQVEVGRCWKGMEGQCIYIYILFLGRWYHAEQQIILILFWQVMCWWQFFDSLAGAQHWRNKWLLVVQVGVHSKKGIIFVAQMLKRQKANYQRTPDSQKGAGFTHIDLTKLSSEIPSR